MDINVTDLLVVHFFESEYRKKKRDKDQDKGILIKDKYRLLHFVIFSK